MPEFDLVWVCDPVVRWPGVAGAPGLTEEICAEVDAVIVATPPALHLEPALLALRCGRAVFVEKPFVPSSADVEELRSKRGRAPLMVGHLLLFHPAYQCVAVRLGAELAAGASVSVEVERRSPARGTGTRCPWWTLAPHDLALLCHLFGTPQGLCCALDGEGVVAELHWDRARATLRYGTSAPSKVRIWTTRSNSGEMCFDEETALLSTVFMRAGMVERETLHFAGANPLRAELEHFAECVRSGAEPLTGFEHAAESVRLLCWGEQQLQRQRGRASAGLGVEGVTSRP